MAEANRVPVEPSAAARIAAHNLREMFVGLINEGFSESQALHILGVMLASTIQAHGGGDG